MTEKYFIFESQETGEVVAYMGFTAAEGIKTLQSDFENCDYRLVESFVADSWGDLRIDSIGLDVF